MESLDPIVDFALRGGLALILILAALHKLRDRTTFEGQVQAYDILPLATVHAASRAIPLSELAIALFLLMRSEHAALAGVILFTLYAAAIAINLLRGRRDIDCGCGGQDGKQALHPALVIRNLVLAIGAALISFPVTVRSLTLSDYAIAVCAGLVGVALYMGFNTLIAQLPASQRLKA